MAASSTFSVEGIIKAIKCMMSFNPAELESNPSASPTDLLTTYGHLTTQRDASENGSNFITLGRILSPDEEIDRQVSQLFRQPISSSPSQENHLSAVKHSEQNPKIRNDDQNLIDISSAFQQKKYEKIASEFSNEQIIAAIKKEYINLTETNEEGDTFLHTLALIRPDTLSTILKNTHVSPSSMVHRNKNGYTVLDCLYQDPNNTKPTEPKTEINEPSLSNVGANQNLIDTISIEGSKEPTTDPVNEAPKSGDLKYYDEENGYAHGYLCDITGTAPLTTEYYSYVGGIVEIDDTPNHDDPLGIGEYYNPSSVDDYGYIC